jgi:hypothetical protein
MTAAKTAKVSAYAKSRKEVSLTKERLLDYAMEFISETGEWNDFAAWVLNYETDLDVVGSELDDVDMTY